MVQHIMVNKLKRIIKSTILCIRFPFLYPRNRFTDLHYNNWKIVEFHRKWWKHTEDTFILRITNDKSKSLINYGDFNGHIYTLRIKNDYLEICDEHYRPWISIPISKYGKGKIIRTGWENKKTPYLVVEDWEDNPDANHFIKIVHAKWLQRYIKFLDWINAYPLQLLHCIPSYTELDAMESGWRKAFGIQMCKEIRAALLRQGWKSLFKYRITQIKEKFGELRWYDEFSTSDIQDIISKYEDISRHTCIVCGKPATKMSTGWICPFCDEHIGDRNYTEIK